MRSIRCPAFLIFIFFSFSSFAENAEWEIQSLSDSSEFSYQPNTKTATAVNGVIVRYRDPVYGEAVLQADRMTLDQVSGDITAEGKVILHRDGQVWKGEHLTYNFLSRAMVATNYSTGKSPFFVAGSSISGDQSHGYEALEASLTTDDVKNPNHRIRAKKMRIVPGKYFSARNATLYIGKVPVMFFPYLRVNLDQKGNRWSLTPGYRSRYGGYLLSSYHSQIFTNLTAKLHFDYRTRRGFGGGSDFTYDLQKYGIGETRTYFLDDALSGLDLVGKPISRNRFRVQMHHKVMIRTNLTARLSFHKLSDPFINRDFFEAEYRRNTQPRSFFEIEQLGQNFSLSLLAQPQVNDFYERIERLPEVRLSAFRQRIGNTPIFYESESSAGYLGHRFANYENDEDHDFHKDHYDHGDHDFHATRLDTWHQLSLPHTFFGWLNVQPRFGARSTYYTASKANGETLKSADRHIAHFGIEANFRASRTYLNLTNRLWSLNGLRHIFQPSLNYVYVPNPDSSPAQLPQFDAEIPSLRWLPIEFPFYNSIDSIDAQNVIRLSIRNKLQTKKATGQIANFLDWHLFSDLRIDPHNDQSDFGDLNSDLHFQPRDWLRLNSYLRYDIEESAFRLANHQITILPNDLWNFSLGHLFLRDEFDYWGSGNNVFYSRLFHRFNENWGARLDHQFEARDGRLEEQSYTIYRDFRSWTGALSFRIRDERNAPQDYTFALVFSLKAFPRFSLGEDTIRSALLFGR